MRYINSRLTYILTTRDYGTERSENLTQSWKRKMQFSDAIRWRHNKSKMSDGRHIENHFWLYLGAILADQSEIWKLEGRWRSITYSNLQLNAICRYRSRDLNCNFRKFKMADGIIYVSQLWIIRFRSNLVRSCRFPFQWWTFDTKLTFKAGGWQI